MATRKYINIYICILVAIFAVSQVHAQETATVRGTVVDSATGRPLDNVSIQVAGTNTGASSDAMGEFSVRVNQGQTLHISHIGYAPQSIVYRGQSTITVQLSATIAQAGTDVVVIGYGTQSRQAVTTSIASISGNAMREVPTGNVTSALQGRVPGVVMTQTNSQPGANMQIRIRGTRSLMGDNNPLVVLDGIPYLGSLGDINPNDIKSIDVLKDASATAIYGSRGANGVIMVTTNKGVTGQPARFTYSGYQGIETLFHRYPMMTGDQLYKLRGIAGQYITTDANGNVVPALGADEQVGQNTDWQKLMFSNGEIMNHNIGITGGTDKTTYAFNAGYYKQTSLMPDQGYSRISLRGAIDQKIGKYIQVGFTTNENYGITTGQILSLTNALLLSPLINPYNADGTWKVRASDPNNSNQWLWSRASTEALGDAYADNQKTFGSYNSIYGIVRIPGIDGLSYRVNLGLNYWTLNRGQYQGVGVFNPPGSQSTGSMQQQNNTDWTVENLLTYDKRFGKHHLNLTGLYSAEQTQESQTYISATNILADFFQYNNLGQVAPATTGSNVVVNPGSDPNGNPYQYLNVYGLESWMGRAMYDYDNRYMISIAFRGDGSSRLAPGHQWHSYPAISAGWNIANEQFMKDVRWVNTLKLRVGWGQTSNQAVTPYQTLGQLAAQPYNFGSTTATGYYVNLAPNPLLGWEYSKTWNFGVDFGFLKNRLTGSIDYYLVNTSDVLYKLTLPPTAGISNQTANVGSTSNKGLEIALNGTVFDNPNGWSWDIGVNFSANKNRITSLASGVLYDPNNFFFVGHPINVVYDFKKIGIWQQNDPYLNNLEQGGSPGMIKVQYNGTYNADGTPTRYIQSGTYGTNLDDRQVMQVDPDWQGGFNTRVAYKQWDLTVLGMYQHGGLLVSNIYNSIGYLDNLTGQRGNVEVNYWTPTNTSGTFPYPAIPPVNGNPKYGMSLGYFSGSYFKVSTISLGYNFNKMEWVKKLGVQDARLYFSVQNAFVLFSPYTKQSGQDPVPNSFGNQNVATSNLSQVSRSTMLPTVSANTPSTRAFLLGLNLTF